MSSLEDERIRQQCEAREDYFKQKRDSARRNRELLKELKAKDKALEEKDKEIEIEMLKAMLSGKR